MSEENSGDSVLEDEILEEAIKYVVAGSKGSQYKYPEGWDKNMKRSVRKRANRVIMMGVEVMYRKNKEEVRIIQSREEQLRILEMCHSEPTSGHFGVKKTFNRVRERFYWKGMCKDAEELVCLDTFYMHSRMVLMFALISIYVYR